MRGDISFAYLGADGREFPLAVPHPTVGGAGFSSKFNLATQTNANGELVGQLRGAARETQQLGWSAIAAEDWWRVCRWLRENGPFFYLQYFNHCLGEWTVGRFYAEGFSCDPILVQEDGRPAYYENAAITLLGTGAEA